MHNRLGLERSEGRLNSIRVGQIAFDKGCARIDRATMSLGQVVEYTDPVALIEQQFGANAPDVARSANDENLHRASCGALVRRVKANKSSVIPSEVEGSRYTSRDICGGVLRLRFASLRMTA